MLHFTESTVSLIIISSDIYQYAPWKQWGESSLLERVMAATICRYVSVVPNIPNFRGIFKPPSEENQTVVMSYSLIKQKKVKKTINWHKFTILVSSSTKQSIWRSFLKNIHSFSSPCPSRYGNCDPYEKETLLDTFCLLLSFVHMLRQLILS